MSITVRLWNDKELDAIKTGKDKWLATVFMNVKTFSQEGIRAYPYNLRRTFVCQWLVGEGDEQSCEEITIHATDKRMLKRFLEAEYNRLPDFISEQITRYKDVTF